MASCLSLLLKNAANSLCVDLQLEAKTEQPGEADSYRFGLCSFHLFPLWEQLSPLWLNRAYTVRTARSD